MRNAKKPRDKRLKRKTIAVNRSPRALFAKQAATSGNGRACSPSAPHGGTGTRASGPCARADGSANRPYFFKAAQQQVDDRQDAKSQRNQFPMLRVFASRPINNSFIFVRMANSLECGGKRSATPLSVRRVGVAVRTESGVARGLPPHSRIRNWLWLCLAGAHSSLRTRRTSKMEGVGWSSFAANLTVNTPFGAAATSSGGTG